MVRRSFRRGELLLVVLRLIQPGPMSEGEIFVELDDLLGDEYRLTPGSVVAALEALAGEGLVELEVLRGAAVYRTTREGLGALDQRADAPVLARAGRAIRSEPGMRPESTRRRPSGSAEGADFPGGVVPTDAGSGK